RSRSARGTARTCAMVSLRVAPAANTYVRRSGDARSETVSEPRWSPRRELRRADAEGVPTPCLAQRHRHSRVIHVAEFVVATGMQARVSLCRHPLPRALQATELTEHTDQD